VKLIINKLSILNLIKAYKEVNPDGEKMPKDERYSKDAIMANIIIPRKGNQ
jgi:hypothetical protein